MTLRNVTQELPTGQYEEDEVLDPEQEASIPYTDQDSTEEQNYREPMDGVLSYMGWTHIPDVHTQTSSAKDNPFAAPKQQPVGKVSVNLPTDDCLCRKMYGLNRTLTQGYLSTSSETGGLQRDQFVKHSKSHPKWYGLHANQDRPTGSILFWHCDSAG